MWHFSRDQDNVYAPPFATNSHDVRKNNKVTNDIISNRTISQVFTHLRRIQFKIVYRIFMKQSILRISERSPSHTSSSHKYKGKLTLIYIDADTMKMGAGQITISQVRLMNGNWKRTSVKSVFPFYTNNDEFRFHFTIMVPR